MFAVVSAPSPTAAGPLSLTDDPEPVDYGHWEISGFSMGTIVQGDSAGILPGTEINYGALPNVQLHVKVRIAFNSQSATGTQFGFGDTEFGVKYRFIDPGEDDWWPQVAVYPAVDAPTGDTALGLGTGATHA
jgi:Putative MetA-pathway of phenol degradation